MDQLFTAKLIVNLLAGGLVVFVVLALLRSVISGGKRVVWEILRVTAGLVCMCMVGLSRHGNIGPWGAWVGFGGIVALLLASLFVGRSYRFKGKPP
jgi:hypothetical protein